MITRAETESSTDGDKLLSDNLLLECAADLAELDAPSMKEAMEHDADAFFERILLPMSLPWSHRIFVDPRAAPPCDIDEMPAMRGYLGEDSSPEEASDEHEAFVDEGGRADGGVLYLARSAKPSLIQQLYGESVAVSPETARSPIATTTPDRLSFRVNSVSTRSSLCQPNRTTKRVPIPLIAVIPQEEGVTPPKRLVWAKVESSRGAPFMSSLLTGEAVPPNKSSRASRLLVTVRLNGQVLTADAAVGRRVRDKEGQSRYRESWEQYRRDDGELIYPNDMVNKAIRDACTTPVQSIVPRRPHCVFFDRCDGIDSKQQEFCVAGEAAWPSRHSIAIRIKSPVIVCTPSTDGVMQTTCPVSGTIAPSASPMLLLEDMSRRQLKCAVCWEQVVSGQDATCRDCQSLVHRACASLIEGRCEVCHAARARETLMHPTCSLCPFENFYGHVVSRSTWEHSLCHVWQRGSTAQQKEPCVLCSTSNRPTVKCAAEGCAVLVHPMCAALVSQANTKHHLFSSGRAECDLLPEALDSFLCTQYTLAFTEASAYNSAQGKHETKTLPVVFCGIHNPRRRDDRWGWPPGNVSHDAIVVPRPLGTY